MSHSSRRGTPQSGRSDVPFLVALGVMGGFYVLLIVSMLLADVLSVWVAVPLGYLLSRYQFRGKALLDVLLDIPIVLPPLVIGLCLLILFSTPPGRGVQKLVQVTYAIPSVIIAQFAVAAAFAV